MYTLTNQFYLFLGIYTVHKTDPHFSSNVYDERRAYLMHTLVR